LLLLTVVVTVTLAGFGCKTVSKEVVERSKPISLKYWRVFDGDDTFSDIILAYNALHPNITIQYRKLLFEEYERELLNAIAEDRGPDIFSLHHTKLPEWQERLLPVAPVLSVPFREIQGTIKKEAVTVIRNVPGMSVRQLANDFIDVVSQDVILLQEQQDPRAPMVPRVYGLPLHVDTLVLYYNRDMLNAAGIAQPPRHWREFQEQVKKITQLDEIGTIIRSATALGTADNVERSADILALLMMQNGAQMSDADGMATFDRTPAELAGRPLPPAAEALIFYSDFANPEKEVYTWNDKMPNSFDTFVDGQTAFFFGYSYHLPLLRLYNPALNFSTTAFPQIEGNEPVNNANYWVEVVSEKTEYPNEAWDFVQFAAKAENAQKYLAKTGKPTALRSLINSQLENIDLSVFAAQLPNARSWYRGHDAEAMEDAFLTMIDQMLAGEEDPARIITLGATKVNQTIR